MSAVMIVRVAVPMILVPMIVVHMPFVTVIRRSTPRRVFVPRFVEAPGLEQVPL